MVPRSQMHLKYIHYFGNEASESLLEAYGIVTRSQESAKTLLYKQCPHCNEPNKPEGRFCTKCKMVLTYDAYHETLEKEQKRETELNDLKKKLEMVQEEQNQKFNQLMTMIKINPKLVNIKPEALIAKSV
jgi:integrase/recombinase XerD